MLTVIVSPSVMPTTRAVTRSLSAGTHWAPAAAGSVTVGVAVTVGVGVMVGVAVLVGVVVMVGVGVVVDVISMVGVEVGFGVRVGAVSAGDSGAS